MNVENPIFEADAPVMLPCVVKEEYISMHGKHCAIVEHMGQRIIATPADLSPSPNGFTYRLTLAEIRSLCRIFHADCSAQFPFIIHEDANESEFAEWMNSTLRSNNVFLENRKEAADA